MSPIRVVVADDHPLFREGLRAVVATAADLILVGAAETGEQAIALVRELGADVVLMDLQMPGMGGLQATKQLTAECPTCAVLILTMSEDDQTVDAAARSGARGYLVKGAAPEPVLAGIRAVARGEAVFGADVAGRVLARLAAPPARSFPELTDREHDVLRLLAAGLTNAAIAERLVLAPKSVRNLVSSILVKLGAGSRVEAGELARQSGISGG